ncbi:uncharacterized protein LOC124275685 [Haliotis rubra]|uniref:uncharacterized protein LOC124275685 n=1 Tax=Haliotis rubra TaxID=36100 RepID=UPI001EE5F779|nr:uncharacterized protein LOC124275685 [Haliotis rubra]
MESRLLYFPDYAKFKQYFDNKQVRKTSHLLHGKAKKLVIPVRQAATQQQQQQQRDPIKVTLQMTSESQSEVERAGAKDKRQKALKRKAGESQINDAAPFEFQVSNLGPDYTDLTRTRLHVKVKVTQTDGTALAKDENVAPVNLFMQSLFSQVTVYLQNQLVSSTNNHYAYKSMMRALLGYGAEAKNTQLGTQLFARDYAESEVDLESSDVTGSVNGEMALRGTFIALSKELTMSVPVYEDIFDMNRLLPNDVCKVKVNPALILAHNTLFKKSNALYPYTKSEVKVTSIPTTQQTHTIDNVSNPVANRYVVGLVESSSLNGSYTVNPYNFKSFMLKKITLYIDGVSVPGQPAEVDDVASYVNMLDGMGLWKEDKGNAITRSEFLMGNALFAFDIDTMCRSQST